MINRARGACQGQDWWIDSLEQASSTRIKTQPPVGLMIGLAVGDFFAISPAIIGALVTVPVYFIGRVLFNWRVGLIAASLIAILPGGFMRRTLLGFSDHHALEVLLSTTAVLFLILAVKHAQREGLSFIDLAQRDWRKLARPLIYALLAGIALGLYLLTWTGGLLFVFIIALYAVVQYIADHLRGRSTDYLLVTIGVCFFITLLVILPFVNLRIIDALHIGFVVAAIVGLGALSGASRLMDARGIRRTYYPAVLAGLGGLGLFYLVAYSSFDSALSSASRIFSPSATLGAARPLFLYDGGFSFAPVWRQYAITFFLAIIALGLLIYAMIRKWRTGSILLVVWSLVTFSATMGQGRFSYYFARAVRQLSSMARWAGKDPGQFIGANLQIVGDRRDRSPVPLDALEHYQLIYDSPSHEVKIFEYVP